MCWPAASRAIMPGSLTCWSPLCCACRPCLPSVASLSGEEQVAQLLKWPAIRDTFLIKQGGKVRYGGRRAGWCRGQALCCRSAAL